MHLLTSGVGRPAPFSLVPKQGGLSWANGFEVLRELSPVKSNISPLDRGRARALVRLRARLRGLYGVGRLAQDTSYGARGHGFVINKLGWPLSYWRQFTGEEAS